MTHRTQVGGIGVGCGRRRVDAGDQGFGPQAGAYSIPYPGCGARVDTAATWLLRAFE